MANLKSKKLHKGGGKKKLKTKVKKTPKKTPKKNSKNQEAETRELRNKEKYQLFLGWHVL